MGETVHHDFDSKPLTIQTVKDLETNRGFRNEKESKNGNMESVLTTTDQFMINKNNVLSQSKHNKTQSYGTAYDSDKKNLVTKNNDDEWA